MHMDVDRYFVFDGINGCGKGLIVDHIGKMMTGKGYKVFDARAFTKTQQRFPRSDELLGYDVLLTAEPTYAWVGAAIRQEMFYDNGREYDSHIMASAYALDRLLLYRSVVAPFLADGGYVFQERSISTSLILQTIGGELSVDDIIRIPAHQEIIENLADVLVIVEADVDRVVGWLEKRDKQDNDVFEIYDTQRSLGESFRSSWFREVFESRGTKILYMQNDSDISTLHAKCEKLLEELL